MSRSFCRPTFSPPTSSRATRDRDDLGRPKTAVIGGRQPPTAVSSQALKRALRTSTAFVTSVAVTLIMASAPASAPGGDEILRSHLMAKERAGRERRGPPFATRGRGIRQAGRRGRGHRYGRHKGCR